MAIRPPGSSSTFDMIMSSTWTILFILGLIAGHLVLVVWLYLHFSLHTGMEVFVDHTGLPAPLLWSSVAISVFLDLWIYIGGKREQEKKIGRY